MARQAETVGQINQLTVKNPNLEKAVSIITRYAETEDGKEMLANIGLMTKEDKMADTEKDLNELNMKLAEENKNLKETAELLFKENQTLRNELNVLNVIILRKTAQEVGVQYGQPQTAQSTESTAT